jgi:hypothetical protein
MGGLLMDDFCKPDKPQICNPYINQSLSLIAYKEAIQKASTEKEEVRHITIGSTAAHTAEYIYNSILDFSETIDDSYDVGMQVTSLGSSVKVYLTDVNYYDPHLIIFNSESEDGTIIKIVQHVTQLNYALVALKKLEPEKPKRKIGFNAEKTHNT